MDSTVSIYRMRGSDADQDARRMFWRQAVNEWRSLKEKERAGMQASSWWREKLIAIWGLGKTTIVEAKRRDAPTDDWILFNGTLPEEQIQFCVLRSSIDTASPVTERGLVRFSQTRF